MSKGNGYDTTPTITRFYTDDVIEEAAIALAISRYDHSANDDHVNGIIEELIAAAEIILMEKPTRRAVR